MSYHLWHRVLAHALLGVDPVEFGEQASPDLARLAQLVEQRRGEIDRCRAEATAAEGPWPVPPTTELADGLPWSQYLTALHQLRSRLDLLGTSVPPARAGAATDRESQRLMADRPPHW